MIMEHGPLFVAICTVYAGMFVLPILAAYTIWAAVAVVSLFRPDA